MPRPLRVNLWPFNLENDVWITCDVGYLCTNFSLPRPLCSRLKWCLHWACMNVVHARCFKLVEIHIVSTPFKCPCKRFDVLARRTDVITNMHIPVNRRLWTAIHATEALRIGHASCAEKYRSHRCLAIITIPTNYFIYPRMIAVPSVTPETYTA